MARTIQKEAASMYTNINSIERLNYNLDKLSKIHLLTIDKYETLNKAKMFGSESKTIEK